MPRPCWNFWGPYWPISRVSDHLRAGPGPRASLVARCPTTPCQSRSGSPMGLQRYVHRGRAHGFLLPHPSHGALTGPLSLPPPFLIISSFSPSKRRREPTTPRAHISRSILLLSREHADGIEYGPVRPLRGKGLYFSPVFFMFTSSLSSFPAPLSIPPSSSSSSSSSSSGRDSRTISD